MTDSLVFAKITLQVTPSMFLLTILKQQSVIYNYYNKEMRIKILCFIEKKIVFH